MPLDKNTLSTLKAQWVILKDEGAKVSDRVAAYKMINLMQEQHAEDDGFTPINLQETRYKIFESVERAEKGGSKPASKPATESAPRASSSVSNAKVSDIIQNFKFEELSDEQQESAERQIRAFFERKVIAMKVASEERFAGLGFDNVQSVGQATAESN
ncbi:MAG: hypothetical protein KGH65_05820 [Candidatus Micrarchaeota archaeon]|nr:hypothetical protein [Candidatus Micrarchaeota archaeon]